MLQRYIGQFGLLKGSFLRKNRLGKRYIESALSFKCISKSFYFSAVNYNQPV